ncbi:uncharacterized protein LOC118311765 isoform X1 [Scophthalmus maximus]|uniref:uncharacterized protein LOC118311765 isoform X1 n=2 Tax=Scophthalmus maximus TaxID=52904 RepID=UPI001FA930DC|nr:uncharacterized protein LOC118311765 isoform X1 [Scophthalmus maximus]
MEWRDSRRLNMMLFLVCPTFWSSFLVLWPSQVATEGHDEVLCQGDKTIDTLFVMNSSGHEDDLDMSDVNETFTCLLYPTNVVNCSWSFLTLEKATQLSVFISICDIDTAVQSLSHSPGERVGSRSLTLSPSRQQQHGRLFAILQFNMSLHDKWTVYTYVYDKDTLELLSPPPNIKATVKDEGLLVTWGVPQNQSHQCFQYELDLGDQEAPKRLRAKGSYTELNADPTRSYRVRMRTKKVETCSGSLQWSEWSPTVVVKPSVQSVQLNTLLIVLISLGIPMILLAVLLLVRYQRVFELLFPPIPCPPPKYIHFLEKDDASSFFHPALSSKAEEEITEVEEAKENPGKTF